MNRFCARPLAGCVTFAGLSLVAQSPASNPRRAGRRRAERHRGPRRCGRTGRPGDGRHRLDEAAVRPAEDTGGTTQDVHPSAWIPPRARAVRSGHQGPDGHHVRRQRPDVRPREPGLHGRQGSDWRARPRRTHLPVDRLEQRRRLRQAHHLRRQAGLPPLRHAVRARHDPDEGVQRAGSLEVHRHEPRRRRRQEGAVRHGLRPHRQRRAPGKLDDLDVGQLAVHDLQHVPLALDARRGHQGNIREHDGLGMGPDPGRRRQAVVPRGLQRHPGILAVPDRLRQHQHSRRARPRRPDRLGRAGARRGHAERTELRPDAGRILRSRRRPAPAA